MKRKGRTTLWVLGVAAVVCPRAWAQDGNPEAGQPKAGEPRGSQPVMLASFGFGGVYAAERWGPITVSVTPGDKPLSGSIIVEYAQDQTQSARIAVPFAATPERTTYVPIVAA